MNHDLHSASSPLDTMIPVLLGLLWLLVAFVTLRTRAWRRASRAQRAETQALSMFDDAPMFWVGTIGCSAGVLMHLPMFAAARAHDYRMVGMPLDPAMVTGMALIMAGMVVGLVGLVPSGASQVAAEVRRLEVSTLDDAPLSWAQIGLVLAMAFAVTIDLMKTTTLSFVTPGVAAEYGLSTASHPNGEMSIAWLGAAGVTGTVIGSYVWGKLGDRIGRRPALLYAGLAFIATSVCGFMPTYELNLLMCLLMGMSAGGMLPIVFALMAETIPARHRGWLMVLVGGDIAGALVVTSWLSGVLTPEYGWRILWLVGMPTGVCLLLLNRWIPESPRYLLARGRTDEAELVMKRIGARVTERPVNEVPDRQTVQQSGIRGSITVGSVLVMAAGVGSLMFGFQFWLPMNLEGAGFSTSEAAFIFRDAAVLGIPATMLIAASYGLWSSRGTVALMALATATSVIVVGLLPPEAFTSEAITVGVLIMPLAGVSSMAALLIVYGSEISRTLRRGRDTGVTAAATKLGGWAMMLGSLAGIGNLDMSRLALIGGIPLAIASALFVLCAPETRRRSLDEIPSQVHYVPATAQ